MSRVEKTAEPSMDEILASIRKIISEDPAGSRPAQSAVVPPSTPLPPPTDAAPKLPPLTRAATTAASAVDDVLDDLAGSVASQRPPTPASAPSPSSLAGSAATSDPSWLFPKVPGPDDKMPAASNGAKETPRPFFNAPPRAPAAGETASDAIPTRRDLGAFVPARSESAAGATPHVSLTAPTGATPSSPSRATGVNGTAVTADPVPEAKPAPTLDPFAPRAPFANGPRFPAAPVPTVATTVESRLDLPFPRSTDPVPRTTLTPPAAAVPAGAVNGSAAKAAPTPPVAPPTAKPLAEPVAPAAQGALNGSASATPSAALAASPAAVRPSPTASPMATSGAPPAAAGPAAVTPAPPASPPTVSPSSAPSTAPATMATLATAVAAPTSPSAPQSEAVRTLEDTVAELLRPMLRQWLDANMPRIVEKALRVELADSAKKKH